MSIVRGRGGSSDRVRDSEMPIPAHCPGELRDPADRSSAGPRPPSRCRNIRNTQDSPIESADEGWELFTRTRATFADPINGDMTQIDFPVAFLYDMPENGSFELKLNSAEALRPLLGPIGAALPACTQLEVVDVHVRDPEYSIFAKVGLATGP